MIHKMKREHTGSGFTECITPTCSCGWRGIGYEAHNDWQYTLVKEQEDEHRKTTMGTPNKRHSDDDGFARNVQHVRPWYG